MNVWPPGGFSYEQPVTGTKFGGNEQFKAQALLILSFRKGNGLARATYDEVAEDLMAFTCARLPALCTDSVRASYQGEAAAPRGCSSCGGRKA